MLVFMFHELYMNIVSEDSHISSFINTIYIERVCVCCLYDRRNPGMSYRDNWNIPSPCHKQTTCHLVGLSVTLMLGCILTLWHCMCRFLLCFSCKCANKLEVTINYRVYPFVLIDTMSTFSLPSILSRVCRITSLVDLHNSKIIKLYTCYHSIHDFTDLIELWTRTGEILQSSTIYWNKPEFYWQCWTCITSYWNFLYHLLVTCTALSYGTCINLTIV